MKQRGAPSMGRARRELTELQTLISEHAAYQRRCQLLEEKLQKCQVDLGAANEELAKATRARESAEKQEQFWRDVMGGGATCICGLSAVISAHLQYSVSTMLPALVAAAVNLRDLNHAALVLCVFTVLVLGTTVVQHFSRVSDRAPPLAAFASLPC